MVSVNSVFFGGNLTRDPEMKEVNGGACTKFGVASNYSYRNRDGEVKEDVCFAEVETWGKQAETVDKYLKKGSPVLIEGSLKYSSWEGDDGKKRSKLYIRARRVQFLPKGKKKEDDGGASEYDDAGSSESQDPFA